MNEPRQMLMCTRCNTPLVDLGEHQLMLKNLFLTNWLNPTIDVDVLVCPSCRHMEWSLAGNAPIKTQNG